MELKNILTEAVAEKNFDVNTARKLVSYKWRPLLNQLKHEDKKKFESFFLFVEGFVEDSDEGFIEKNTEDNELRNEAVELLGLLTSKN